MRLYRLVGSHDDHGYAEYHGDQPLNLPGLWRPATRAEYIAHYLLKARFSYVDLLAILIATSIVTWLDLPLWFFIPLTVPLVLFVLYAEKRFR